MSTEPTISRPLTLRFRGDWGQGHITRSCCWLMQEVSDRTGAGSHFEVHAGRGQADNIRAVARGEVDVALTSPSVFTRMAVAGTGLYEGEPLPYLRALGQIPQNDRMVLALDRGLGIGSFAELRERQPALTLATGPLDGVSTIGFGAEAMMAACGIDESTLQSWGGRYVRFERPTECLIAFRDGEVDGVVQEALTAPFWVEATEARDTVILPIEDDVASALESAFGWPPKALQAGYFKGQPDELMVMDFSDFAIVVREDMPDDVAYLLAWCLSETKHALEMQYHHRDPNRTGISYPLIPSEMARTPIPLHSAAEACYRDLGHL